MKDEAVTTESLNNLEDMRSKKIIFVCNCLLNSNNKVMERARYPGIFSDVVKIIDSFGIGIMQLPCPEMLYSGCQRYWGGKNVFESAGYRKFCRTLAAQVADYMENYHMAGYQVVCVLGCDGSPTCGVHFTNHYENGGGRPKAIQRSLLEEPGIFIEELKRELEARNLPVPKMDGLGMDIMAKSTDEILADFKAYIAQVV
ncbi:CD3072 family TudS-related putative desulfidase [Ethanoligenens sp.]|uniref:CD3072 family TudS-related putative desulfidase n=1 Tax=Ethanoligenens sp. TaxID=2099655 RepID=UPI0039EB2F2F